MLSTLKKLATMASVIMALTVTIGLSDVVAPAYAASETDSENEEQKEKKKKKKKKYNGHAFFDVFFNESGDPDINAKPGQSAPARGMKTKRTAGRVCCFVPRKGLTLVKSPQCRQLRGRIVPPEKCARLGSKPSEAYFVKVDSETTTEADEPPARGPKSGRRK